MNYITGLRQIHTQHQNKFMCTLSIEWASLFHKDKGKDTYLQGRRVNEEAALSMWDHFQSYGTTQ